MGRYLKRRNVKEFWKNPLENLCYTLSVIAFVAGVFGIFAWIGKADSLLFAVSALAAGVLLIVLGKILGAYRKKHKV